VGITRFRKNIVHKLLNLHLNSTTWCKKNKYLKFILIRRIKISYGILGDCWGQDSLHERFLENQRESHYFAYGIKLHGKPPKEFTGAGI